MVQQLIPRIQGAAAYKQGAAAYMVGAAAYVVIVRIKLSQLPTKLKLKLKLSLFKLLNSKHSYYPESFVSLCRNLLV